MCYVCQWKELACLAVLSRLSCDPSTWYIWLTSPLFDSRWWDVALLSRACTLDSKSDSFERELFDVFVLSFSLTWPGDEQPAYAALLLWTRDILFLEMWAGQMLCEAFNWILKKIVREERPNCKSNHIFWPRNLAMRSKCQNTCDMFCNSNCERSVMNIIESSTVIVENPSVVLWSFPDFPSLGSLTLRPKTS